MASDEKTRYVGVAYVPKIASPILDFKVIPTSKLPKMAHSSDVIACIRLSQAYRLFNYWGEFNNIGEVKAHLTYYDWVLKCMPSLGQTTNMIRSCQHAFNDCKKRLLRIFPCLGHNPFRFLSLEEAKTLPLNEFATHTSHTRYTQRIADEIDEIIRYDASFNLLTINKSNLCSIGSICEISVNRWANEGITISIQPSSRPTQKNDTMSHLLRDIKYHYRIRLVNMGKDLSKI